MSVTAPLQIVEDSRYREHRAPRGHPECPERLVAVGAAIAAFEDRIGRLAPRAASREELLRVHDRAHLRSIEQAVQRAPGQLDPDTYVSPASLEIAELAAGGCVDLARSVARGESRAGLAAVRPPGHHAEMGRAMGFCLFNNVAIAARALQHDEGLDKLLILDWDVHHGNGTQHSFEDDPSVLLLSTHQSPHYPGTGDSVEVGTARGVGATVNVPMPAGCGDGEYVGALSRILVPVAERFAPDMILVSCGFDAHRDDPLASMELSQQGYLDMTRIVRALADELCDGRVVFVLEGGYAPSGLAEGTTAVIEGLLEARPEALPRSPDLEPGSMLGAIVERVARSHSGRYPGLGAA